MCRFVLLSHKIDFQGRRTPDNFKIICSLLVLRAGDLVKGVIANADQERTQNVKREMSVFNKKLKTMI